MASLSLPTFLPCLKLGLQVNHHDFIQCFSCELPAMRHVSLPKKGEPGAIKRLNRLWSQGHLHKLVIIRSIRFQGYHQCLDYLHVLVFRHRNCKELIEQRNKWSVLFQLALCDSGGPLATVLLPKNCFLYSFFKGGLRIISAPDSEACWLELQLTISWDPEMSSLVLCFCPFYPTRFKKQNP